MDPRTRVTSPRAGRLRGVSAGLVCALGATGAHLWAGGEVAAPAVAVVVLVCVALGATVVRAERDPARTLAVALVAQVVWHAVWVLGSTPDPAAAGGGAGAMLLTHLLAALVTTVVSLGLERELAGVVVQAVGLALRGPRGVVAPVTLAGAGSTRAPHVEDLDLPRPWVGTLHALRAPPR